MKIKILKNIKIFNIPNIKNYLPKVSGSRQNVNINKCELQNRNLNKKLKYLGKYIFEEFIFSIIFFVIVNFIIYI